MGSQSSYLVNVKQLTIGGILAIAMTLSACGGDDPPPPVTVEPTLASIQTEIFTPTCATASCHSTAQLEAGLDLSAGNAYSSLIDASCTTLEADREGLVRVAPGDPEMSFLLQKLRGGLPAEKGRRMPYDGPYLSDAEIDVIEQWIADGAPEE